jgi:hypothetical protein
MSHESSPSPDSRDLLDKMRSLEEALAFQSHEHDQLREHFLTLTKALESCERRVRQLEQMHIENKRVDEEE